MTAEQLSSPGGRIRLMRKAKGWKQTTFAEKLGTSQPAVSQWETNKWMPGLFWQHKIAAVLGADRAWLFDDPKTIEQKAS